MIYEWRTYEAMPGKLPALHTHLEVAASLFTKHESGEREKSWAAFLQDPDWQTGADGVGEEWPLVAKAYNQILRPTAYSPRG